MTAHLLDSRPTEAATRLERWLSISQEPRFRTKQILEHLFDRQVADPERMSNIPRDLRARLQSEILTPPLEVVSTQESVDGTRKYGSNTAVSKVMGPSTTAGRSRVSHR